MEEQKKNAGIGKGSNSRNSAGITLVSLVVSIIVMLILAGVSINAVVGDNGILTQAQEAALATELARIKEELEYMFLDYNLGDDETSISEFLNSKVADGTIDEFNTVTTGTSYQMIVVKNGYYFYVAKSNGSYYATQMQTDLSAVEAGFAVVTQDSFETSSGTMSFDAGSGETTVVFYEEVSGEMNFDIVSGTVTIYVTQDMTLTNENMARSAVDIHEGATLNLYFVDGAEMYVDSGYGTDASGNTAGKGGYAGVHVPEGATLNLYGEGTLTAIGGDAGSGSLSYGSQTLTAGGGGAGAGIGGHGGAGGKGVSGKDDSTVKLCGDGYAGENCGIVNIYNSIVVYAYGGAGGSGGTGGAYTINGSGGGGGYPAAGIGRWWCRWRWLDLLCWWRWIFWRKCKWPIPICFEWFKRIWLC